MTATPSIPSPIQTPDRFNARRTRPHPTCRRRPHRTCRPTVLGLKWTDIDLKKKRIHLNRGLVAVGYEVHQTRGKTKTARRTIELDATTIAVLEGWRSLQAAGLAAVGIANEEGWVFTDGDGKTIHPHAVYESFKRIVRNAGVPEMRFHDLRHTHGSLLLKEGIPVKVVSERLGHANIAHTLQTYQHVLPGMQADAATAAERLSKPRPTTKQQGSEAKPAASPKRRTTDKKPTKNNPGERRGTNRRKAA